MPLSPPPPAPPSAPVIRSQENAGAPKSSKKGNAEKRTNSANATVTATPVQELDDMLIIARVEGTQVDAYKGLLKGAKVGTVEQSKFETSKQNAAKLAAERVVKDAKQQLEKLDEQLAQSYAHFLEVRVLSDSKKPQLPANFSTLPRLVKQAKLKEIENYISPVDRAFRDLMEARKNLIKHLLLNKENYYRFKEHHQMYRKELGHIALVNGVTSDYIQCDTDEKDILVQAEYEALFVVSKRFYAQVSKVDNGSQIMVEQ